MTISLDVGRTRCSGTGRRQAGWIGDVAPPPPLPDEVLQRHADIDEAVEEAKWRAERRADAWRAVWETSVLLAVVVIVIVGFQVLSIACALFVVGPLIGLLIHRSGAGRIGCALLGGLAFALCVPSSLSLGSGIASLAAVAIPAILPFAIYGLRRESRAYRGWE